jgi:hypothetical protein
VQGWLTRAKSKANPLLACRWPGLLGGGGAARCARDSSFWVQMVMWRKSRRPRSVGKKARPMGARRSKAAKANQPLARWLTSEKARPTPCSNPLLNPLLQPLAPTPTAGEKDKGPKSRGEEQGEGGDRSKGKALLNPLLLLPSWPRGEARPWRLPSWPRGEARPCSSAPPKEMS